MKTDIKDLTLGELSIKLKAMGEPAHRARQIYLWIYRKYANDFTTMTDIPAKCASKLSESFDIGQLELAEHLASKDGTEKFLFRLKDKTHIETVLIREKKRTTLCLSTQVGCKFRCRICASGMKGFTRNLTVGEIVDQLIFVQRETESRMTNVVFMGMGEPLDNYDNLVKAIRIINDSGGIALGARKITISTCGITPAIRKLRSLGLQVELSVSLHGADDKLRNALVPANKKYPLKELVRACKKYTDHTGRIITLEYALISGKNDSDKDAENLSKLAKKLKAKVNLIKCNAVEELRLCATDKKDLIKFESTLRKRGVNVTIRRSRGEDILAACGQLAARRNKR